MKQGECSICEGWIYWNEALITKSGEQYCESCYKESKSKSENKRIPK